MEYDKLMFYNCNTCPNLCCILSTEVGCVQYATPLSALLECGNKCLLRFGLHVCGWVRTYFPLLRSRERAPNHHMAPRFDKSLIMQLAPRHTLCAVCCVCFILAPTWQLLDGYSPARLAHDRTRFPRNIPKCCSSGTAQTTKP